MASGSQRRRPVGRWRLLKGQQREHQRSGRDRGDDPEQRPPAARMGLDPAHGRPEGHRPEDAQVHDHRGLTELRRAVAEGQRRHGRDQQQARAQALQHPADNEHGRGLGRRGQHRSDHQQGGVEDHHPPLGEMLGERHRQHRAHRITGVGQPGPEAHGLQAHVQIPGDDRGQRLECRGQRQEGNEGEDHHRRRGGVAPGQPTPAGQPALTRHRGHGTVLVGATIASSLATPDG